MHALITGAAGFVGRNLYVALSRRGGLSVTPHDVDAAPGALDEALSRADAIFHLAGVNRPPRPDAFQDVNVGVTQAIVARLGALGRRPLIVFSSSTQAGQDNAYGRSKRAAEDALASFSQTTGAPVRIFRLPGVFGKWCRPNYNSVVATFCHNIARDLPIEVSDPGKAVTLVHVDDVVASFLAELTDSTSAGVAWRTVEPVFTVTLGDLERHIRAFRAARRTLHVPDCSDRFVRRLYGTYQSYVPEDALAYDVESRTDVRGVLAEMVKSPRAGQIFVSRTKPGVTRGNHYHDLKVERFFVIEGDAVIRFRPVGGGAVTEYRVSGSRWQAVEIPPGYTHSIENVGTSELVVLFWACEPFDPERPDTFPHEVPNG
jgi:UDP-2-acetamido-2,6-beta-L-arabino-hexul-4-ose reductase